MKHLYLILVATMIALSAAAQAPEDESTMTREQREQHTSSVSKSAPCVIRTS